VRRTRSEQTHAPDGTSVRAIAARLCAGFGLLVGFVTHGLCADAPVLDPSTRPPAAGERLYRPPPARLEPRRVGGPTRSLVPGVPAVTVLAPDHLGLTRSAQPILYWFIAEPTTARIELSLIEPGVEAPLLETVLPPGSAGIRAIDLRALDVRLAPGIEYEWSVAVVTDPAQRSRDVVSGGAIMRVDAAAGEAADASIVSEHGFWYDLLMALDHRVREQPADTAARSERAALLDEVGLGEVAAFERAR
jgi:hypothetical protein